MQAMKNRSWINGNKTTANRVQRYEKKTRYASKSGEKTIIRAKNWAY